MANEFARVAGSGEGLEGLSDGVLETPIFGAPFSPNFAELLLFGYLSHHKDVPDRIIETICKPDPDGLESKAIRQSILMWNGQPEKLKGAVKVFIIPNMANSVSHIKLDGSASQIKLNSLSSGVITYQLQIGNIVDPQRTSF